ESATFGARVADEDVASDHSRRCQVCDRVVDRVRRADALTKGGGEAVDGGNVPFGNDSLLGLARPGIALDRDILERLNTNWRVFRCAKLKQQLVGQLALTITPPAQRPTPKPWIVRLSALDHLIAAGAERGFGAFDVTRRHRCRHSAKATLDVCS